MGESKGRATPRPDTCVVGIAVLPPGTGGCAQVRSEPAVSLTGRGVAWLAVLVRTGQVGVLAAAISVWRPPSTQGSQAVDVEDVMAIGGKGIAPTRRGQMNAPPSNAIVSMECFGARNRAVEKRAHFLRRLAGRHRSRPVASARPMSGVCLLRP